MGDMFEQLLRTALPGPLFHSSRLPHKSMTSALQRAPTSQGVRPGAAAAGRPPAAAGRQATAEPGGRPLSHGVDMRHARSACLCLSSACFVGSAAGCVCATCVAAWTQNALGRPLAPWRGDWQHSATATSISATPTVRSHRPVSRVLIVRSRGLRCGCRQARRRAKESRPTQRSRVSHAGCASWRAGTTALSRCKQLCWRLECAPGPVGPNLPRPRKDINHGGSNGTTKEEMGSTLRAAPRRRRARRRTRLRPATANRRACRTAAKRWLCCGPGTA